MYRELYLQLTLFDKEIQKFNELYDKKYYLEHFLNLNLDKEKEGYYLYLYDINNYNNINQFCFKIPLDEFNKYDPHKLIFSLIVNGFIKKEGE